MSFWQSFRQAFSPVPDAEHVREARQKLAIRPQLGSEEFARTHFVEEKQAVAQKLWQITKQHSVADITGIVPTDRFVEDLRMDDLDSMSLVELTIHLEKEFKVEIPGARLKEIRTFGELVDEICVRINSKK